MTAPRHVLHVVRPAQGGIRQHVLNLLAHTDRSRFALSLAAPADFLATLPPVDLQAVFPLPISASFSAAGDFAAAARLSRLAHRADLIHAHGLRAGWIAALSSFFTRKPLLVTAHNLIDPSGRAARMGMGMIGRRAQRVLAVSQAVASGLEAAGVPSSKIVVIPNGIDRAYFTALPTRDETRTAFSIPSHTYVVGCIARLSLEKGVDVLLRTAALIPEMSFLIAGDGPLKAELAASAPPNVRLLGRVGDTRTLLAAVDVIAIPSRQEGQGIVALEAMATNVPIVASRVGGLAEMLTDGRTALLVPPDEPTALAAALQRIQDGPDLRRHLTANAGVLVEDKYELGAIVRAIEGVYDVVILAPA